MADMCLRDLRRLHRIVFEAWAMAAQQVQIPVPACLTAACSIEQQHIHQPRSLDAPVAAGRKENGSQDRSLTL
jgi:hypothetical protein